MNTRFAAIASTNTSTSNNTKDGERCLSRYMSLPHYSPGSKAKIFIMTTSSNRKPIADATKQIRNSNDEIRKKSEIQMSKFEEVSKRLRESCSNFGFRASFGFRHSNFGFLNCYSPEQPA